MTEDVSRKVVAEAVSFPIEGSFNISRGAKTSADVVVVRIEQDGAVGRGECTPYGRYGETLETVLKDIESAAPALATGAMRHDLHALAPSGAARNAIDCALWDLEAKRTGRPVYDLAGLPAPGSLVTAYTLSLDTPDAMAAAAQKKERPLLKLKLAGDGEDDARIAAVRAAAPNARLIVDANEGVAPQDLPAFVEACALQTVSLIEQPLPANDDDALIGFSSPIPLCADESAHTSADLPKLRDKYACVNIKLDKTGGLTEALKMRDEAREIGFQIMVGCMVASSLAMAPAVLVAQGADFVDLDGPLLLATDRDPALVYDGSIILPPSPALWG